MADGFVLQIATRYLDNFDAAYGLRNHQARIVITLRTRAAPMGLNDDLWARYELGAEYDVTDPASQLPATRNVFSTLAPGAAPAPGSIRDLVQRGAIILVCDFALGHLVTRLCAKHGQPADATHRDLLAGVVPSAFAVPSGIFGLARAQNAGCAYLGA